jgi:flagellar biogenesis protein FliO
MFDLSQPIPTAVIVGSIVFILALVGIGLLVVRHYKKRL